MAAVKPAPKITLDRCVSIAKIGDGFLFQAFAIEADKEGKISSRKLMESPDLVGMALHACMEELRRIAHASSVS